MGGLGAGTCGDMRGADDTHTRAKLQRLLLVFAVRHELDSPPDAATRATSARYWCAGLRCWECRQFSKGELVTRPVPFSQHGEGD